MLADDLVVCLGDAGARGLTLSQEAIAGRAVGQVFTHLQRTMWHCVITAAPGDVCTLSTAVHASKAGLVLRLIQIMHLLLVFCAGT